MELEGRVAPVTGASRGIGAAIAERLSEAGADAAVGYGDDEEAARGLVARIERKGRRAIAVGVDLRDSVAVEKMCRAVEHSLGPVDVLVSNAGIAPKQGFEEITDSNWDRMMEVNVRPAFLLARRLAPGMRERGWGRVVFISSVAAFTGGIVGPHYTASEAALIEGGATLPGGEEEHRKLVANVPVGRLGTPQQVAQTVHALVTNPLITAQSISVDGGMYPR